MSSRVEDEARLERLVGCSTFDPTDKLQERYEEKVAQQQALIDELCEAISGAFKAGVISHTDGCALRNDNRKSCDCGIWELIETKRKAEKGEPNHE